MRIETERLIITVFDSGMVEDVHKQSLDADTRRFLPDEVFETVQQAEKTIAVVMDCYTTGNSPQVYPVLKKDGTYIGYVQAVRMKDGFWEIGYQIGSEYRRQGYATEAVKAFMPEIMKQLGITQLSAVCMEENIVSRKVLEHCGFQCVYEGIGTYQGSVQRIYKYAVQFSPKDIVVKFFEDGYTNKNYDFVMRCMTENYIDHSPASARSNADAVGILKIVAEQFSELRVTVLDVFSEKEMVAARVRFDGIHSGTCMGIPATGKSITFEALENFRVIDGKITESWGYWPDKEIEQKLKG